MTDEGSGSARLQLTWPDTDQRALPRVSATAAGGSLRISFSEPVSLDPSNLARETPQLVALARMDAEGKNLRITLRSAASAQVSRVGSGYVIDLRPVNPPKDDPVGAAATGGVELAVGERPDYTRLTFTFPEPATVTPSLRDGELDLRFNRRGDIDIARLNVSPPRFVRSARRAVGSSGLTVSVRVDPGVTQRSFVDGRRIVVDLLPPPPESATREKALQAAISPAPRGGVVRAAVAEDANATRFTLRWAGPVRAAAFRRGDAVWLVFDADARIELGAGPPTGRRHRQVQSIRGQNVSALRISAPPEAQLSARAEGATWTFSLSDRPDAASLATAVRRDASGRIIAGFDRDGVVRAVDDPSTGDRFLVGLFTGPARGVAGRFAAPEAIMLPTVHGAAAELRADGLGAVFEGGAMVISQGQGVGLRAALVEPAPASLGAEGRVKLATWANEAKGDALRAIRALEREAAMEPVGSAAALEARLALARFLLGADLAAETLGVLRLMTQINPETDVEPDVRAMRGVANVMMGRFADAQRDLGANVLAEDPTIALWRGYASARGERFADARRDLLAGRDALGALPRHWRFQMADALADSALRMGDIATARTAYAAMRGDVLEPDERAALRLIQARLARFEGDAAGALAMFEELARSPVEPIAVRAALEAIRLKRDRGAIDPKDAVEELEALRFRWRGDSFELDAAQTLGHVYAEMGRWRDGLNVMNSVSTRYAASPAARRMRVDMGAVFERLFLHGDADQLEPIQALGLFYEFRDLTPFGADGDRIVRLLAARLVEVDLLEQAAQLLQHQVDNRLRGIARAQIALDLAMIYLDDGKPDRALSTLQATRQPGMPADLLGQRRIMEAQALIALGRFDHAAELVEKDKSVEAQRIRAEAAWRRKDWAMASSQLRALMPVRAEGPLNDEERAAVLRAAIAAAMQEDNARLSELARTYGARFEGSPDAEAFGVITGGLDALDQRLVDAAAAVAQTGLLGRFMQRVREGLVGSAPAQSQAPAAPSAAGAAPLPPPA